MHTIYKPMLWALLSVMTAGAHGQTPATPVKGGTVTAVVAQEPTSLVSFLDTKTDNRDLSAKITEGLLRYDAQFKPQPLLATSS